MGLTRTLFFCVGPTLAVPKLQGLGEPHVGLDPTPFTSLVGRLIVLKFWGLGGYNNSHIWGYLVSLKLRVVSGSCIEGEKKSLISLNSPRLCKLTCFQSQVVTQPFINLQKERNHRLANWHNSISVRRFASNPKFLIVSRNHKFGSAHGESIAGSLIFRWRTDF